MTMKGRTEKILDAMSDRKCICLHPESEHKVVPVLADFKKRMCMYRASKSGIHYCPCMDFQMTR